MADLTESIPVQAPAATVYALVSDLPRMRDWSPECTRVTWSSGTPGPAVCARFVGHNKAGVIRWFTFGRVVDADPGRRFAFTIHFGPIPISLWAYDFTPTATGCEVTESWTDHRPAALRLLFRPIFGNRIPRNVHGIHTTLIRLKATAEAGPSPTPPTDGARG
jgi:hypothetical protein